MTPTLKLTKQLVALESITPNDSGCQKLIASRLTPLGFVIENMPFENVANLWAQHGSGSPLFVFAGHTDVVPPGPLENWDSPPFEPTIRNKKLYGRGVADMKGSVAAMVTAYERFISAHPNHKGTLGLIITSDEEGLALHGTKRVVEAFQKRNKTIDYCLIGEPSSSKDFGDVMKIGRRGSLSGRLNIVGIQGHIAYPHLVDNPIHKSLPFLEKLVQTTWDKGDQYFPPTQFQISNIHAGTGASNVIPGQIEIDFNFRYSTAVTAEHLQYQVKQLLQDFEINYQIEWHPTGKPFLAKNGKLSQASIDAIQKIAGLKSKLLTTGGTSDGRFLIDISNEMIELGPVNATIHQTNESIGLDELEMLTQTYEEILRSLFL